MKITTKGESENGTEEIVFTNDEMNNNNFIDMVIGEEEYTISVDDLYHIGQVFMRIAWAKRAENDRI